MKKLKCYIINWLRRKLGIEALDKENSLLKDKLRDQANTIDYVRGRMAHSENHISRTCEEIRAMTRCDADIGFRGNSTIILTGVYKNRGYVQFYDLGEKEFKELVERFKYMEKTALIRHIDESCGYNFRGMFDI